MTEDGVRVSGPARAVGPGGWLRWVARAGAIVVPAALAAIVAGCSAKDGRVPVYPVQGRVTVAGEAPVGALVIFYPTLEDGQAGHRPSGKVEQDGTFRLTTYEADDGAPTGDYTATLLWNKLVKKGNDYVAGPNAAPAGYAKPDRSPWKVSVAADRNELAPLAISE